MKHIYAASVMLLGLLAASCTHSVDVTKTTVEPDRTSLFAASNKNAQATCEAQYEDKKQNYLSAIQQHIASKGPSGMEGRVPLDQFRAEINAAYNMVVSRCKTHVRCLEANGYDESRCYISAYDRKDAERAFSDLAIKLRELANDLKKQEAGANNNAPAAIPNITVTAPEIDVTTTVDQTAHQKQKINVCCKGTDCCKDKRRCCHEKRCCKGKRR